jgi:uncharacterized membrane protein
MSKLDQELFELCKQVYEKTGWRDGLMCIYGDLESEVQGFYYPIVAYEYTSDYLLEKLQPVKADYNLTVQYSVVGRVWKAFHRNYGSPSTSDTPLKALLKLTLALSKAGEL